MTIGTRTTPMRQANKVSVAYSSRPGPSHMGKADAASLDDLPNQLEKKERKHLQWVPQPKEAENCQCSQESSYDRLGASYQVWR